MLCHPQSDLQNLQYKTFQTLTTTTLLSMRWLDMDYILWFDFYLAAMSDEKHAKLTVVTTHILSFPLSSGGREINYSKVVTEQCTPEYST